MRSIGSGANLMSAGTDGIRGFFEGVVVISRDVLDHLPIPPAIQPLAETFAGLVPAIETMRAPSVAKLVELRRPPPAVVTDDGRPAAMNTVGILADRLTILICKEWYLRNRMRRGEQAAIVDHQTREIIDAFAYVKPGHATLLEKVSSLPADAAASGFEDAYYGILEANVLMWETQEVLYMSRIDEVPVGELRDYIRLFSLANMKRNAYIKYCETLYWSNH